MPKLKRIHINQHKIRANKKHGTNEPVMTVKVGKHNLYGHEIEIEGPSKVVYRPEKPLSCGARVWVETMSKVLVDGEDADSAAYFPVKTAVRELNDLLKPICDYRVSVWNESEIAAFWHESKGNLGLIKSLLEKAGCQAKDGRHFFGKFPITFYNFEQNLWGDWLKDLCKSE